MVQIGLVETAAGVCGVLGAVVAPRIIERTATGVLTVVVAWSFVPLLVPLIFWNNPAVVMLSLSTGVFLNPAGNAGIGSYKMSITPPELVGRVQSMGQFLGWSTLPLAPVLGGALLAPLGGPTAMAVLTVLCALVALIPTLSRTVRSVPRPADVAAPRMRPRHPIRSSRSVLRAVSRGSSHCLTSSAACWTRSRSRQPDRSMASSQLRSRSSRRSRWSRISSTCPSRAASGVRNSWLIVATSRLWQLVGAQRGLGLGGDVLDQRDRADVGVVVVAQRDRVCTCRCTRVPSGRRCSHGRVTDELAYAAPA